MGLRDKISHGELDLNEDMTSSTWGMCIYVIMASFNDLEQYLSSSSSTKYLSDYSALFHPKRLLIEEIDEVTIQVQNLSEHPSLYETQDLGPEDPLTKLQPRLNHCLDQITNEHFETVFQALRRYCSSVQLQTLYRPKYEYVIVNMFRRLLTQMRLTLERSMENVEIRSFRVEFATITYLRSNARNCAKNLSIISMLDFDDYFKSGEFRGPNRHFQSI